MHTSSEHRGSGAVHDFAKLFAPAQRRVTYGPGDVRELALELEQAPLRARSRLLNSGPLMFVHGENRAAEDLVLRHTSAPPIVAVHVSLAGSAVAYMPGLGASLVACAGEIQLFASPTSHSVVQLHAHVTNRAFRLVLPGTLVLALAARHPELETLAKHVESGAPLQGRPVRTRSLARLIDDVSEIMNSEHYGAFRPLFLESRALGWLALALAQPGSTGAQVVQRRDIERMHQARDFLLSRLANPPTLAEVARAVGTNDFSLKRHFKAVFGQPVHGYLLGVRLAEACHLLKDTNDSVKEIGAAVGYAHPNHFSTAFRRMYGVTPASYRAASRV